MSQKKKLSKRLLALIISVSVALVFLSAILITNIFIPVKYLSAYLIFSTDKPQKGEMRISFINVGKGDCTLVELPDGKTALFDGGNGSYNNQLKIFGKLNYFGINKIDYLFCTSSAAKRCGGLAEIVKYKDVGRIYAPLYRNYGITDEYRDFRSEVNKKHKNINECVYGASEYSEEYGYGIYVLYPEKDSPGSTLDSVHSANIWISYGGVNVLLLGDLKTSEMRNFYDAYTVTGFDINGHKILLEECNIVKVSNDGNNNGVYAPLYDLIAAETAVISTNKEPTLALEADIGVHAGNNIYRTDEHGTITISIRDGGYNAKKER